MITLNGREIKKSYFSNTEVRIKEIDLLRDLNTLELKYETENPEYKVNDDLMCLYFLKQELDRLGKGVKLVLWSMPYQRMDHKSGSDIHTLPYVAKFIKDLKFEKVTVIEPHSSKTREYLDNLDNNVFIKYPVPELLESAIYDLELDEDDDIRVIFPDAGACKRYASKINVKYSTCTFEKKRDHETNQIVKHQLSSGQIKPGSVCFILDDICSSGQTLLDVAYYAKMAGASQVYLVVAHCENKALEGEILKESSPVTRMYTTKSMISCEHPKIRYLIVNLC